MAEVAALSNKIASLETEINALAEGIKALEGRTDDVSRQRLTALAQEKAALAQQVAALQQKEVLLMQQQATSTTADIMVKLQQEMLAEQQHQRTMLEEQHAEQKHQRTMLEEQHAEQKHQRTMLEELEEQQSVIESMIQGVTLDLYHPTSSLASSRALKSYRDNALVFYYGSKSETVYKCMVTGTECSKEALVAGHIYRQQWPKSMLARFNIGLHKPENIIIMQPQLEKAFDKWQWVVLPEGPDDYKIHVLYPQFLNDPMQQYITGHAGQDMRWQDIHGEKLKLPAVNHPSRRLCGFHAALAIRHAEVAEWIAKGSVVVPGTAWDSPTCDKQLMQKFMDSLLVPSDVWQQESESVTS